MEAFTDYLVQNPIVTVISAAIIFVLTLIFVVKRIFSFVITLILLVICLIAGYIVISPESAMKYYKELADDDETKDEESPSVKDQLEGAYKTVKDKGQEYFDKLKQSTDDQ